MRDRILLQLFHRIILASRDYKRVSINNKTRQLFLRSDCRAIHGFFDKETCFSSLERNTSVLAL